MIKKMSKFGLKMVSFCSNFVRKRVGNMPVFGDSETLNYGRSPNGPFWKVSP